MTDVDEFLEHHGIKGMKWGVRKKTDSNDSSSHTKRNAAIVLGSAAAVGVIAAGAIYAKRHMNVSTSELKNLGENSKRFSESLAKEPVGIVHAARGKNVGFTFPGHGGLSDPIKEYEKAGFHKISGDGFHRYGENLEKIAARFTDPEGRVDRAGRKIFHEVMLPQSLAHGITKFEEIPPKVWPMIKDTYQSLYES